MIEDQILLAELAHCESEVRSEQAGRSDAWPSTAALAYWHNAQTLRRFLTAPHHP